VRLQPLTHAGDGPLVGVGRGVRSMEDATSLKRSSRVRWCFLFIGAWYHILVPRTETPRREFSPQTGVRRCITQVRPAAGKLDEPCGAPTVATAASEWSPAERLVSGRAPKPECNKVACRCAVCSLWRCIKIEHISWEESLQRCSANEANTRLIDREAPVERLGSRRVPLNWVLQRALDSSGPTCDQHCASCQRR
jgi:hypothetical protein